MKKFNILLLGDSTVGNTSFIDRYCGKGFNNNSLATMGIESRVKDIVKNNNSIKLCIYDTAGQERYRKIVNNYYKGADGIILMYDVSNIDSFNAIRIWIESIKLNLEIQNIGFIEVENKCDLSEEEKKITEQMREEMEKNIGFEIIIASAKHKINVDEAFDLLVDQLLELKEPLINTIKIENKPKDKENDKKKKEKCC